MRLTRQLSLNQDEKGMASILITMIFMIVISLLVLGFAQVAEREQRSSLDRQLSSQAFYAAESGVNDVQQDIDQALKNNETIPSMTTCNNASNDPNHVFNNINSNSSQLSTQNNVQYTCVLVNPNPTSLLFDPISTEQSKIAFIQSDQGTAVATLTISWQDSNMPQSQGINPNFASCPGNFPPDTIANWPAACAAPVLRVDIVPADIPNNNGGWENDLDTSNTLTLFLRPTTQINTPTVSYSNSNQGAIVPAACLDNSRSTPPANEPFDCNVNIDATALSQGARSAYYMRVQAIYNEASVNITGQSSGSSQPVQLTNGQVVVDSTGRAQDVLRRIQVRLPINPLDGAVFPDNALQAANSICKQFFVKQDGSVNDYDHADCPSGTY